MWVEKNPRRPDFCGRPPCPLCYDWVGDNGIRMDGREKFYQDMLGTQPLAEEKKTLDDAAELIHAEKVRLNEKDKEKIEQFHADDDMQRLQRQLNARAKVKPVAKKTPRKPTLDEIDVEAKVKEEKAEAQQRRWEEYADQVTQYSYSRGIPGYFYDSPNRQATREIEEAKEKALTYAKQNPMLDRVVVPAPGGGSYEFRVERSRISGSVGVELFNVKEKIG